MAREVEILLLVMLLCKKAFMVATVALSIVCDLWVVPWCEGDVLDPSGGFVFLESFLPTGCVLAFGNDLVWLGNSIWEAPASFWCDIFEFSLADCECFY